MNLEEQAGGQLYTNLCLMPKMEKKKKIKKKLIIFVVPLSIHIQ
jgi:hypothetical protein